MHSLQNHFGFWVSRWRNDIALRSNFSGVQSILDLLSREKTENVILVRCCFFAILAHCCPPEMQLLIFNFRDATRIIMRSRPDEIDAALAPSFSLTQRWSSAESDVFTLLGSMRIAS